MKKLLSILLITAFSACLSSDLSKINLMTRPERQQPDSRIKIHEHLSHDSQGNYEVNFFAEDELKYCHIIYNLPEASTLLNRYTWSLDYEDRKLAEKNNAEFLHSLDQLFKNIGVTVKISSIVSRDTPKEMIKKEFDSCLKAFYVNFKNFDDRETISMSPFKWMIVNLTLKKFIINQENKSEFTALLEKTKLLFDNHIAPLLEQK